MIDCGRVLLGSICLTEELWLTPCWCSGGSLQGLAMAEGCCCRWQGFRPLCAETCQQGSLCCVKLRRSLALSRVGGRRAPPTGPFSRSSGGALIGFHSRNALPIFGNRLSTLSSSRHPARGLLGADPCFLTGASRLVCELSYLVVLFMCRGGRF